MVGLVICRDDPVVTIRRGHPSQHQVGETVRDLLVCVEQALLVTVLHLSLQPDRVIVKLLNDHWFNDALFLTDRLLWKAQCCTGAEVSHPLCLEGASKGLNWEMLGMRKTFTWLRFFLTWKSSSSTFWQLNKCIFSVMPSDLKRVDFPLKQLLEPEIHNVAWVFPPHWKKGLHPTN